MGFAEVRVAQRVTGGCGIRVGCSASDNQASRTFSLSMNKAAQRRSFGREIDTAADRFKIMRGNDADKGKVLIQLDPDGPIQAGKSMRGSIRFKLQAFPPIPPRAVKSTDVIVISSEPEAGQVIVRLPWGDGTRG